MKQLAAIAQFDVQVRIDAFPDPLEPSSRNDMALKRFVFVSDRPAALAFQHPSAAELVFRLLAWAHGEQDPIQVGARDCAAVLARCVELYGPEYALNELLRRLLRTRLKLTDDSAIKRALLTNECIVAAFDHESVQVSIDTLSTAAALCRDLESPPPYAVRLAERLEGWVYDPTSAEGFNLIGGLLSILRLADADAYHALQRRLDPSRMKALVLRRGTLVQLLSVLENSTDAFAASLLRAFDGDEVTGLVERFGAEKSIATLPLALRKLGVRSVPDDPNRTQLDLFQERLDPCRMKALLLGRGTLVELLGILQCSTNVFAAALLRAFDADEVTALVEGVGSKKSIATLPVILRELGVRSLFDDPNRTHQHLFEERLDLSRMKALLLRRGTLVELLGIVRYSTNVFAAALLRAFDADELAMLVERTIDEQESLGNVKQWFRALGKRELMDTSARTQLGLF